MGVVAGRSQVLVVQPHRFGEPMLAGLAASLVIGAVHLVWPTSLTFPLLVVTVGVPTVWACRARWARVNVRVALRIDATGLSWSDDRRPLAWEQVAYVEIWRRPAWWWWLLGLSEEVRFVSRAQADFAARAQIRPDAVRVVCRLVGTRPDPVIALVLSVAPGLEVREVDRRRPR